MMFAKLQKGQEEEQEEKELSQLGGPGKVVSMCLAGSVCVWVREANQFTDLLPWLELPFLG